MGVIRISKFISARESLADSKAEISPEMQTKLIQKFLFGIKHHVCTLRRMYIC